VSKFKVYSHKAFLYSLNALLLTSLSRKDVIKMAKSNIGIPGIAIALFFIIVGISVVEPGFLGSITGDDEVQETEDKITEKELQTCDGVASVNALWDDKDNYKVGTDPATKLTVFEDDGMDYFNTISDDATDTSVPTLSDFKALGANDGGTPNSNYFGKEIEFETVCNDLPIQKRLNKAGAPSITIVNDDGITKNANGGSEESVANETTYTPEAVIESSSDSCASVYGAWVVFEYDASHMGTFNDVSSNLDCDKSTPFYVAHSNSENSTMDQYATCWYEGTMCDGKDDTIKWEFTTKTIDDGTEGVNQRIHWYPVNKDLNADTYELIEGLYDEDDNLISIGNTSQVYYINKAS